jgi:hypothetical protein
MRSFWSRISDYIFFGRSKTITDHDSDKKRDKESANIDIIGKWEHLFFL